MPSKKIPARNEVPKEYTWATEDIFATKEDWEAALAYCMGYVEKLAAFAGTLHTSGKNLYDLLQLCDEITVKAGAVRQYAHLNADTDTSDSNLQAMGGKAMSMLIALHSAMSFMTPELISLSDETLEKFYAECPELELYRRAIDEERRLKDHILSPAEEKLLAAAGEMAQSPDTIGGMFRNADLKFPDAIDSEGNAHQLTQGSYIPLVESTDRVLRKSAFETLYNTLEGYQNTTASILDAQVKQLKFFASARKYNNTLEASLAGTNVPVAVYHSLIESVHNNMEAMYRYVRLRKKALGVDELHMYDLYTGIVEGVDQEIPFKQAQETVLEALAILGKDYTDVLKEAFENRWIDVYENVGKRSGAYSSGGRPHPYVLLNHKDNLDTQFTLAHEMGHAMHSYLSVKNQPVVYSNYVIFVAEVASTCNEVLMMQHLLNKTEDKKQRAYLINYFLEQFRTTLYRQTMFAEFEMIVNDLSEKGETLTADLLNKVYYDLNKLYYGNDMIVDREISLEWSRIPHFFYDFYVFQYATGFSAAIALAMKILKEGQPAVDNYLKFLSSGGSDDPISLLKIAGIDMASPEPVNEALKLFDDLVSEMEKLLED